MPESEPLSRRVLQLENMMNFLRLVETKHLGELKATERLVELCHIDQEKYVLVVGCGVGVIPCYFAQRKREKARIRRNVSDKRNKTKVKTGGFLSRFFQGSGGECEAFLPTDEVINTAERLMYPRREPLFCTLVQPCSSLPIF